MNLNYHSDDESSAHVAVAQLIVSAAPDVGVENVHGKGLFHDSSQTMVTYNPSYLDMTKPTAGPQNPFSRTIDVERNMLSGVKEEMVMRDHDFETQRRNFNAFGYAADPSDASLVIGNLQNFAELNVPSKTFAKSKLLQKKRKPRGDATHAVSYLGPWASFEDDKITGDITLIEPSSEEVERTLLQSAEPTIGTKTGTTGEISLFHGDALVDYLGRSYLEPPRDLGLDLERDTGDHECFTPKKLIHTWSGHLKGVNLVRLFPRTGHLMLSASMDTKIKLWDVYHDRKCLRTFLGHEKAIRDVCFSNDGKEFLSCSYDKYIKLWDTETGQCKGKYLGDALPYCVTFNPDPTKQPIFLCGRSDKKIVQYDSRTSEIVQDYDEHQGPVNTITFINNNTQFASTSDDKSIKVWEFGLPIVVKNIAEQYMHAITAVSLHPSNNYLACQSMDNQILVYNVKDKFTMHRKKRFSGHNTTGYACQISFSPDGKYLMSGDASGRVFFWEWKTSKVNRKFKAHQQVSIGCQWHPQEASRVVTCSWDGTVKYWD